MEDSAATTPPRLWWAWVQQAFYLVAFVDALILYGMWLIESSYNGLRLGYWFGWQIGWWALMLPPFVQSHVGTYARAAPLQHHQVFLTDGTVFWQRIRHRVHFLMSFPVLGVSLTFFILTLVRYFNNCDAGSECSLNNAAWVASMALSLCKSALAALVLLLILKSPALSVVTLLRPPPPTILV